MVLLSEMISILFFTFYVKRKWIGRKEQGNEEVEGKYYMRL